MPSNPPESPLDGAHLAQLRDELAHLPFPPISRRIQEQAANPGSVSMLALLQASREILGDPALAWDPVELLALLLAPNDTGLLELTSQRMQTRLLAAREAIRQLRDEALPHDSDDSAALHLVAVGLGVAMISPVAPHWADPMEWTALAARLLESVAVEGPSFDPGAPHRVWRARLAVGSSGAARLTPTLWLASTQVITSVTETVNSSAERILHLILVSSEDVTRALIVQALQTIGTGVIVTRGVEDDLDDIATRVLRLAAVLAEDPDSAPRGAADLVFADSWEVAPAAEGDDASRYVMRLQWTFDRHVVLRREVAEFTAYDRERASALLELVVALAHVRGASDEFGWHDVLADGSEITVRLGRPRDEVGVEELHARCSERSRFQRYFAPMSSWREGNLRRIAGQHRGATLVVIDDEGALIGLGNVFPAGPGENQLAEIALIVDDAWQGRGVGRLLLEHLLDVAERMGFTRLVAYVLPESSAMVRLLETSRVPWVRASAHEMGPSVLAFESATHGE